MNVRWHDDRPRWARHQIARSAFFAGAIGGGMAVLTWAAADVLRHPPDSAWLVLLALTCVSGAVAVRMPGFPLSISFSDTFTVASALLFGPSVGALTVAADGLIISLGFDHGKRTFTRVLFNATAPGLAMWAAATLTFAAAGPALSTGRVPPAVLIGALALFASSYFALNALLISGAVVIGRNATWWQVWREHLLPLWVAPFAGTSSAGVLLILHRAGLTTTTTVVLLLPLALPIAFGIRAAAERLRHRELRLGELRSYAAGLRSTHDGIILTDETGAITFANPASERLTGWSGAEARGRRIGDVLKLHPLADAGEPLPAGDPIEGVREYRLTRRDGSTVEIEESHAQMRSDADAAGGVITTFRDISRRRALEAQRREALQRAEEARREADIANRAKDEFLAILSHELRTPATAIMGWAHLLRSGQLDEAGMTRALAALDRSARAQNAVLRDLLDLSGIVHGTLRLRVRRVQPGELVGEAIETLQPAAQAKALDVRVEIDPDLPVIDADPDRLRQVLWNLLSNAVKFTPEGGWIHVSARQEGNLIRIEVADSGCGIEPAFLPHLFEQFRQGDSSATRQYGGLGLGLAIVRHVVEAHGGTVDAFSLGRGLGARFTVTLRVAVRRRGGDGPDERLPDTAALG